MEETPKSLKVDIPKVMTPIDTLSIPLNHGSTICKILECELGIGPGYSPIWSQLDNGGRIADQQMIPRPYCGN